MDRPASDKLEDGGKRATRSLRSRPAAILLVIAGVFCVLAPFIPHIDGPPFIGRILIFCGFVHAYRLFSARGAAARLKGAAPVVIALLIGTLILLNDGPHARSLAVMLMIFFVLDGYFKIVASVGGAPVIRNGIPIFRAGLSFFFAIFLAATFPATPIWLLEVFLGVDLISMGVTLFPRVSAARRELDASA